MTYKHLTITELSFISDYWRSGVKAYRVAKLLHRSGEIIYRVGVRTFFWTLTIKLSCSDGIFVGSFLLKLFFFSWCYTTQYIH